MRNPLDVGNFRLDLPCPEKNFCKSFIKIDRNRMAKTVAFHLLCVLRAFWIENLICKYLNKEIINILCGKILQNSYNHIFIFFDMCTHALQFFARWNYFADISNIRVQIMMAKTVEYAWNILYPYKFANLRETS